MPSDTIREGAGVATREDVVRVARSFIGTPYQDYGRQRGVGSDCIGLPIMVAQELDLIEGDFSRYSPTPKQRHAEMIADRYMTLHWTRPGWPGISAAALRKLHPVAPEIMAPGTVGLFWFSNPREPQHFAIFADHPSVPGLRTMIHAHSRLGKVTEASVDEFWTKRLVKVYDLPQVQPAG